MALTLHSFDGDFRVYKAQIAAQYNEVSLTYNRVNLEAKEHRSDAFLAKNPVGKVPVLETAQGCIFESNAIARHVARLRRDTELLGVSFFESGQVDSWVDFCSHDLEIPMTLWLYPVLGFLEFNADVHTEAVADVRRAMTILENHLRTRTFLVGDKVTLADIVAVSTLYYGMKFLFAPVFLAAYPNVTRWFITCVNQPQFAAVLGRFDPCTEELLAPGSKAQDASSVAAAGAGAGAGAPAAKGGNKKANKKAGKKEKKAAAKKAAPAPAPAPAPAKPEKKKGPFDGLAKSPMVMDVWKKLYSNARPDYYSSMDEFFKMLDTEGYSLWFTVYNYNAENTVGFMTSNLVGGYLQRCDEIRRYAFGSMVVFEEDGKFPVEGCWLMRGQSIQPMLDCNPDAEYYTWTKVEDTTDAAVRTKIGHFWCAEEKIDNRAIYDSKIFK